MGNEHAPVREPAIQQTTAPAPAAQVADKLAELRKTVVSPWAELADAVPHAPDPTKIGNLRQQVYRLRYEKKPGYDAFAAYLGVDPAMASYAKAAKDADDAIGDDRPVLQAIFDAIVQLSAQRLTTAKAPAAMQAVHGQCLAHYARLSVPGRHYLKDLPQVTSIPEVEVRTLLQGGSKLAPLAAADAPATETAKKDEAIEKEVKGLRDQILAEDPAKREQPDRDRRAALSKAIQNANGLVLDKLRADVQVALKLTAISTADKNDALHPTEYVDLTLQLDSVQQLFWSLREADEPTKITKIKQYLEARPGDQNLATRTRVMQNESLSGLIRGMSPENQKEISRLVARGTAKAEPIDVLYDPKASPADALTAAVALVRTPTFKELRTDQLFRHAIEGGANRTMANVDGLSSSAYEVILRGWGVIPNAVVKDPENHTPTDQINPTDDAPPDEKGMARINAVFPPTVEKLGHELDSMLWVTDAKIVGALTEFENKVAEPELRDLFRRAKLNPGLELTRRANQDSRIGNIRDKLHRGLSDDQRFIAERVLGLRIDAATVGRIDGKVTLADDQKLDPNGKVVSLQQALREVKIQGDVTMAQMTRDRAQKIADKINAKHMWGGCAKADVVNTFNDYAGKFGCNAEVAAGQPQTRVIDELERLTGLKGKIHAIELIANTYHELPEGGDLAGRIQERVHDGDQEACLREIGLDAGSVAKRNRVEEPPKPGVMAGEADALYTALLAAQRTVNATDLDTTAIAAAGEAWAKAKALDATPAQAAQPGPAAPGGDTFHGTYRQKYGIEPQRHVIEVGRALSRHGNTDQSAKVASGLRISVDDIQAAVTAPSDKDLPPTTAGGYTLAQAKVAADKIWAGLHVPDVVAVRREIDGRRPDEQDLIKRAFMLLSGGIELQFFVRQALESTKSSSFVGAGGEGVHGKGAADTSKALHAATDAASWTETLEVSQKGNVSILTRVKLGLDNGNKNDIFGLIDDATVDQRRTILGDEPTMGLIRAKLDGVDFDRVYGVLTGSADMATRLYSRSEGNVDSSFWRHFSDTDTDGMKRDIKDYAKRRKELHTATLESKGQTPENTPGYDALVQQLVKDDLLKVYENADARKVIDNEFPAWFQSWNVGKGFTADGKVTGSGRELEGMMLKGGEDGNLAAMTSDGLEWSGDMLAQIRKMPLAQRKKYRNDPEFLRKVTEHCTNQSNRKLILFALQSDEEGEDHILRLLELSGEVMSTGGEARDQIARLTSTEITRLRAEPELVITICKFLNTEEQARFRGLLGFELASAIKTTGAVEVAADGGKGNVPQGAVAPDAVKSYKLDKDAVVGKVPQTEVERLGYLVLQSQQRLHLGARRSWQSLLGEAVEVFKADFKPKFEPLPVSVDPPAPGQADHAKIDQGKLKEEEKTQETRLRKQVWDDVAAEVLVAADNQKAGDKSDATIFDAVMKTKDPSDLRLAEGFSRMSAFNDDAEIEKTIKGASDEHILTQWSSVLVDKFDGAGGESFQKTYQAYAAAKTKSGPNATDPNTHVAMQAFQRYVVEPSKQWENLVLPKSGSFLKDHDPTTKPDQQLDRKNPQFAKYRGFLNDRIRALDPGLVATKLGAPAGSDDAAMIASRLRGALTNFHIAQEDYAKARGDGQSTFGADEGRLLDRSFGDYRRELNKAQDDKDATDLASGKGTGDMSPEARRKLDKIDEDFHARATDYAAARDAAANIAATIVGTIIGVIVTALTAGAATPVMMAMYGALVAASAAAGEVATKSLMVGDRNYDAGGEGAKQIASAAITGFIAGGAQFYAGQLTNGLTGVATAGGQGKAVGEIAVKTPGPWARMFQTGVRTTIQSSITSTFDVAGAALDPSIWMHGWDEGWYRALDAGIASAKSKPGAIVRQTITAMIGDRITGSDNKVGVQVKPGDRIGIDRVLKQAKDDLPQNVVTSLADTAIGVGTGDVKSVKQATGNVASATAAGVRDEGGALHEGAVHRGQAERFALAELTKHPEMFKSEGERRMYVAAVDSSFVHGEPPSAIEFAAARDGIVHGLVSKNTRFQGASHEDQVRFVEWVRQAPNNDELMVRAGRDPAEVLTAAPAKVVAPANSDVAKARELATQAGSATAKIAESYDDAVAHEKPTTKEEATAAMARLHEAQTTAADMIAAAKAAEVQLQAKVDGLAKGSPEAQELAKLLDQAKSSVHRAETLASLLKLSELALTRNATEAGLLPKALPAVTEPAKTAQTDFTSVQAGAIPEHATAEQKQQFQKAKELYDRLKGGQYHDASFAKLEWARYLNEHGIEVGTVAHEGTKDKVETVVPKEHKAAHVADQTVGTDATIGIRSPTMDGVHADQSRAAFRELAGGAKGYEVIKVEGEHDLVMSVKVGGDDKAPIAHTLRLGDPDVTAAGQMAGLKKVSEHETLVWVSNNIPDDQVARALGGIIGQAVALAGHKGSDPTQAGMIGQLDAMLGHLEAVQKKPAPAAAKDASPAETIRAAQEQSKVESQGRIRAEIDLMLMRTKADKPGPDQDLAFKAMGPGLEAAVKKYLEGRAAAGIGFNADGVIKDQSKIPAPDKAGDSLPQSNVLPGAPAEVHPYSEADQITVAELRVTLESIKEIDARLSLRDQKNTVGDRGVIAQGETLRRRDAVKRCQELMAKLQLGGTDPKYYEARLKELEAVFPGAAKEISPEINKRVGERVTADQAHREAEAFRKDAQAASDKVEAKVKGSKPFFGGRAVVGDGIAGLSDMASLGVKPGEDGFLDPQQLLVLGGPDLVARMAAADPKMRWGQRAGLFDPANGQGGAAMFKNAEGHADGSLQRTVEDAGDFMTVAELADAMDLARKRMGVARLNAKVERVELQSKKPADTEAWHPDGKAYEVRLTVKFADNSVNHIYLHNTDITSGLGQAQLPDESVLSKEDREALFKSKAIMGGDEIMTGRDVKGKRVLVFGYGPTGAWAAYESAKKGAALVDWTGPSGKQGGNESMLSNLKGIDRVQEAFDPASKVNVSANRILSIKPEGEGALVTFIHGEPGHETTYSVHYDAVVSAIAPNNTGVPTVQAPDGAAGAKTMLTGIDMRAQRPREDGTKAPVLESSEGGKDKDGAVRVIGAAAAEGVQTDEAQAAELKARQKTVPLSADSPDSRVMEFAGEAAEMANKDQKKQ